MFRKILLATLLGASFASVPLVSTARTIIVTEAPPAPREEAPPQRMRHGMVWAPGHYAHRQGQYVWVPGHMMRERHGQHWVADNWKERNGRWEMQAGHWARGRGDRDGDGVPNRFDSRPNNPNKS
jgi:hypothetical protein